MIQQWGLRNDIQQIDRLLPTAYIMDINEIVRAVHWLNCHPQLHIRRSLFSAGLSGSYASSENSLFNHIL